MIKEKENLGSSVFKVCTKCAQEWATREDFLDDPSLSVIGYQASFTGEDNGLFLFNHLPSDNKCNTTLTIEVADFWDLYEGPVYEDSQHGNDSCPGHCARTEDLSSCSVECRNAPIRDILQKILAHNVKSSDAGNGL